MSSMRVISGSLKGRILKGYDIEGTRPTMDRVKESLFASIQDYIEDSIVLDLFAGSGNLGIEAISNGCKKCYFVDNNKKCINVIKENIFRFQIDDISVVLNMDYHDALRKFKEEKIVFDIIFIDPPYCYEIMNELLELIFNYGILSDNGIVVLEYQSEEKLDFNLSVELIKKKKYGDKWVSIYQKLKNNNKSN